MDIEAQIPVLEKAVASSSSKIEELDGYVRALQAKMREMKEDLQHLKAAEMKSSAAEVSPSVTSSPNPIDDKARKATSAFDRVLEKATGLPSNSPAAATGAKLAELEELARKDNVQTRLAAMKENKG
jgi:phage shock protein A